MLNDAPLVSIIIIAYNEERYISTAIESVLNQTYENIELIVVDDGSTDNTVSIARQYEPKLTVISQKNSGGCSAPRNAGLNIAAGRYIGFLDADDFYLSRKIEHQLESFSLHPNSVAVISNYCNFEAEVDAADHFSTCSGLRQILTKNKAMVFEFPAGDSAQLMIKENFTIASTPLYKVEVLKQFNGFCENLKSCEDFHLNYRIAREYKITVLNEVLFKRRFHSKNMSSNTLNMERYYCQSRIDLLNAEADGSRRLDLREYIGLHLNEYGKSIIKKIAIKHIGFFLLLVTRNFISRLY
jgi:glycosyltransferase involved in cell wall biosynthesis